MSVRRWVEWLHRACKEFAKAAQRTRQPARRFRPWLEGLEDRAQPTTVNLTPSADGTLYQDATGQLSNGAGQHFYVGDTDQTANDIRRGAIKFSLSAIPAGSTIISATLTLHMSKTIAGAETIALHRTLQNWGEGTSNAGAGGTGSGEGDGVQATTNDVTWLYSFYPSLTWSTPGGNFVAAASASTSVGNVGSYQWTGSGLVADVQQWLKHPSTNFGWILTGNETAKPTAKQFDTEANATSAFRPVLTVVYNSPVPVPDLAIAVSHTGLFQPGDAADTYAVTVKNVGTGPTNGLVTVTDVLPAGLAPTAAGNATVNGWTIAFSGQTVTATRSDALSAGAAYPVLTVTVSVANDVARSVVNTVTVAGGGDVTPANDTASDPTASVPLADLTMSATATGAFHQGSAASYTVTVHNVGTGPTLGAVTVTDTLPSGLTPTAADNGVIEGWTVSVSGQTITATRSDVLASGSSYPSLKLLVRIAATAPASVTNTVKVAGGGEIDTSNDTAATVTPILPVISLQRRRGA